MKNKIKKIVCDVVYIIGYSAGWMVGCIYGIYLAGKHAIKGDLREWIVTLN